MSALIAIPFGLGVGTARAADSGEFFEKQIRPLFSSQCAACHNSEAKMGGLDLTSAEGLSRGSAKGPIVNPDNPERSRLLTAIRYQGEIKMPPTAKLTNEQIAAVEKWVEMGARWPESIAGAESAPGEPGSPSKHRAFQPLRDPPPPIRNTPANSEPARFSVPQ